MSRPTRDETCLELARVMAKRSTCSRKSVGAVFATPDGRVIGTGYNGAPAGMNHCDHDCGCDRRLSSMGGIHAEWCPANTDKACNNAVHAEANGIAYAARFGLALDGCSLFTTVSPCLACAQLIVNAGIARVVFDEQYRILEGINLLYKANVKIWDSEGHEYIR